MEVTIDEVIRLMKWTSERDEIPNRISEAIEYAIDTMRKYQKIEQILSDWINDDSVGMSDYWMGRIKEVLEDGKID